MIILVKPSDAPILTARPEYFHGKRCTSIIRLRARPVTSPFQTTEIRSPASLTSVTRVPEVKGRAMGHEPVAMMAWSNPVFMEDGKMLKHVIYWNGFTQHDRAFFLKPSV